MLLRWGIVLDRQLLFATDDEDIARRFMAIQGFQVLDHKSGYYASLDLPRSACCDLLPQQELGT